MHNIGFAVCGAQFQMGSYESLTSPGFDEGTYPVNTSCTWVVRTASGRPISATFDVLDLESSQDCSKDYVQFFNGPFANWGTPLGKFCSSGLQYPVNTTGNLLTIVFNSDGSGTGAGFKLALKEIVHDCSDDRLMLNEDNPEGVVSSPGYPNQYPGGTDCIWVIQAPGGWRIQFDIDPLFEIISDVSAKQESVY